jgi:hypothetical protein
VRQTLSSARQRHDNYDKYPEWPNELNSSAEMNFAVPMLKNFLELNINSKLINEMTLL